MTSLFISVLLAAMCLECRAQQDNVLQPKGDVTATEGETVTLGCQYNTSSTSQHYLFWYKQDGNNRPKFILSRFKIGEGKTEDEFTKRFSSTLDSNSRSVPLKISSAAVTDSAVYYCALQPSTNQFKIIFGNGTRLNIEAKEVFEPSYFILTDPGEDNKTNIGSWCLATGFTQQNITNNKTNWDLFNKTEAVRIDGDSLYNEVVPLAPGTSETRCMSVGEDKCEETLQPDEKVNLMSLTILGLRLLFLKTVVFNVLMTLRLWMSQ